MLDRAAVGIPTNANNGPTLLSTRVGSYQYDPLLGTDLDQLWVAPSAAASSSATSSSPPVSSGAPLSGPTPGALDLQGTWRTAVLPAAQWIDTFIETGRSRADAKRFFAQLGNGATTSAQITLQIGQHGWSEYEQGNSIAVRGWQAAYTVIGNTVHDYDFSNPSCTVDYAVIITGAMLRLHVTGEGPAGNKQCTERGPQETVFETATFYKANNQEP